MSLELARSANQSCIRHSLNALATVTALIHNPLGQLRAVAHNLCAHANAHLSRASYWVSAMQTLTITTQPTATFCSSTVPLTFWNQNSNYIRVPEDSRHRVSQLRRSWHQPLSESSEATGCVCPVLL